MTIKKDVIGKNINLSAIKTDKFKTGIITFSLLLPFNETSYINSLVLAGMLRRGTRNFPSMADINKRLDELYASCIEIRSSMVGNNLLLIFTAEFLDERYIISKVNVFDGILEIISDMIFYPNIENQEFNKSIVSHEIKCVKEALMAETNNTRSYAATRCNELMQKDNPCYPTIQKLLKQIEEITPSSIYKYYMSDVVNAPMDIFYIGSSDISNVLERISARFGCNDNAIARTINKLIISDKQKSFASESQLMPVSQGKLAMGFDLNSCVLNDNYHAALVFNEILGGSPSSKLFLQVREKMNICYYCSSSYSIYSGKMLISCGIDIPNKDIAKNAIFEQIDEIKRGKISDFELLSAKKSLENSYIQLYDNPLDIQAFYGGRGLLGINETIDACKEKISRVTVDDVIKIAQKVSYIAEFFVEGNLKGDSNTDIEFEECDD